MNPRYKSNQKWTEFPVEFKAQIRSVFEQNFKNKLTNGQEFRVEGRIYSKEILLRVGLHRKGELRHFNFEVSVDHNGAQEKVIENIHLAVDAIASLMIEYFENDEDMELPYVWTEFPFGKTKLWLQFTTENPDLEAEADKLLGAAGEGALLKNADDEPSEDILDATEEEFDEFAKKLKDPPPDADEPTEVPETSDPLEPQMFRKKKKKEEMH